MFLQIYAVKLIVILKKGTFWDIENKNVPCLTESEKIPLPLKISAKVLFPLSALVIRHITYLGD